jgi:hypothetical protein
MRYQLPEVFLNPGGGMVHDKWLYTFSVFTAIFLFTLFTSQVAWGGIPCNQDADCEDGAFCNGLEICVDNSGVKECTVGYPAAPGCSLCDGQVTQLTLLNRGPTGYIRVYQGDRPEPNQLIFEGWVNADDTFTFNGIYSNGSMGSKISVWVGNCRRASIHTSCSQPIGPGLVKGDFEVVAGSSRIGGLLCPLSPLPCPDDGQFCNGDACDEDTDTCESSGDPCIDDGLYCNGIESCDEETDACVSSGDPCTDDGLYCNGIESCDEAGDQCEHSGKPCIDDGLYCNGTESCDEEPMPV